MNLSTTTFKSEPIAVQKVTGKRLIKLVVKEVTTYSQGVDVKSNSLYSVYDISAFRCTRPFIGCVPHCLN